MKNVVKRSVLFSKGFTLVEMLVVVLIIGILAAIAVPKYQVAVVKSKLAKAKQAASEIKKAIDLYYLQNGSYPTNFSDLDFAVLFNESPSAKTGDYNCYMDTSAYYQLYCVIDDWKMIYVINFGNNNQLKECRVYRTDTFDIYNKVCQQDTGKKAVCGNSYCQYYY